MVRDFDSISIALVFPAMICSVLAEGSLNRVAHLIYMFFSFGFEQIIFDYFVCICCLFTTWFSLIMLRFQPLA